jgi:molybdopterin-guanine dinucleotide biosynthesis protein A
MQLRDATFHPYEICFCGSSNTGKSILISKIIKALSSEYKIGFVKSDNHKIDMDKKGKGTFNAYDNGAHSIIISDPDHFATITRGELSLFDQKSNLIDNDFIIIEGHKKSKIPKFIFLGEDETKFKTIERYKNGDFYNVLGFIGNSPSDKFSDEHLFFTRDQSTEISEYIIKRFSKMFEETPLKGLILSGGKSSRMGQDKSALNYHGKSQVHYAYDILNNYCNGVYVSCRSDQSELIHLKNLNQIHDSFPSMGPTSGILSAMFDDTESSWLVLACDLPYLDKETIKKLILERNPFKTATCYLNPTKNWPEPLCTIYEPKARLKLMQFFAQNRPCPRKALFNSEIKTLNLDKKEALNNVNTPNDYNVALNCIKTQRT